MDPHDAPPPPAAAPRPRIPAPPGGPLRALWHLLQPVLGVVLALAVGVLVQVQVADHQHPGAFKIRYRLPE